MPFTKPTSWVDGTQPFTYQTPEGLVLRGVSTIEECRIFDSIAILDSKQRLHVLLGRDFRSHDTRFGGVMMAMANDLLDNAFGRVHRNNGSYPAAGARIATAPAASGAVVMDQSTASGIWAGHIKHIRVASNGAAFTPTAFFAVAHNAISGSGILEYGNKYLLSDSGTVTGYGAVAPLRSVGLVSTHRLLLNNSVGQLLNEMKAHVDHASEGEVQSEMVTIINRIQAAWPGLMNSQASILFNVVHTPTGPRFVLPQRAQTWAVSGASGWPVGYGTILAPQWIGARATVDGTGDYHTCSEQYIHGSSVTVIPKPGMEIGPLASTVLNGSEAMPLVKKFLVGTYHNWADSVVGDSATQFRQFDIDDISSPMASSIAGVPIYRVTGPIFGASIDDGNPWTFTDFVNAVMGGAYPPGYATGTVDGLPPTEEQLAAAWDAVDTAGTGSPLAQVDWRATWTHEVDMLFFLDLVRIYAENAGDFNSAQFNSVVGVWSQQVDLLGYDQ